MLDMIKEIPTWYYVIATIFSLYYSIRGVMEQSIIIKGNQNNYKDFKTYDKIIIVYIQEFIFKTIITLSSFIALFIANSIFYTVNSIDNISAGTAAILIFLLAWGICGVCGYLTNLIVKGNFPLWK